MVEIDDESQDSRRSQVLKLITEECIAINIKFLSLPSYIYNDFIIWCKYESTRGFHDIKYSS